MPEEGPNAHLDKASRLLEESRWQEALHELDKALQLSPDLPDALIMRGIALSRLGAAETASESFRKAIMIAPYNAKAYFNLAVHYSATAQTAAAIEMAREALRIDPQYQAARQLLLDLEREALAKASAPAPDQPAGQAIPQAPYGSPPPGAPAGAPAPHGWGYSQPRPGTIGFINSLGKGWTGLAWFLAVASIPPLLIFWSYALPIAYKAKGNQEEFAKMVEQAALANPLLMLALLGMVGVGLLALLWVLVDLIHRQGPWTWLVGMGVLGIGGLVCCGSLGMPFVLLPLYLLLRRS